MRVLRSFLKLALCLTLLGPALAQPAMQPQSGPASFSLIDHRDPIATLDGQWRFHPGDDPAYASPSFDDSQWPLLKSDQSWFKQGYKGLSGYGWYRFVIVLPGGEDRFELKLPHILTGYQVFLDGKLVRTVGPMRGPFLYTITEQAIPLLSAAEPVTVQVALRIWHAASWAGYYGGGPTAAATVGATSEIDRRMQQRLMESRFRYTDALILCVIAALAGIASFALLLLRPRAREYLWFAVFCAAYILPGLVHYASLNKIYMIEIIESIEGVCVVGFQLALLFLLRELFSQKLTLVYRIAILSTVVILLQLIALDWLRVISVGVGNGIDTAAQTVFFACVTIILINAARRRDPDARLLILPILLYSAVDITDGVLVTARTSGYLPNFNLNQLNLHVPFLITPGDLADLVLFLGLFAVLLARFARTSREQDRLAAELESARTLQQVLIPEVLPTIPGVTIATAYHPAQQVGGDFFQIIPIASGATLILLGDVSGKGLPAAMTVSVLVGAIRTLAEFTQSPAEILAGLNRRLIGRGDGFTTCLALHLTRSGLLTFANAGHLSPYLNGAELDTAPALPLGLEPDFVYAEQSVQLASHDHLTLLTDGVLEAATPAGELYGFARTLAGSSGSAPVIAEAARSHGQNDDITVLTLDFA